MLNSALESGLLAAEILSGGTMLRVPPEDAGSLDGTALTLRFPEIGVAIGLRLIGAEVDTGRGRFTLRARIEGETVLVLQHDGVFDDEGLFRAEHTWLDLEHVNPSPRVEYIALSIWAMIGLSNEFQLELEELNYKESLSLQLPLAQVASFMSRRLFARKVMTIADATGTHFILPERLSADDLSDANFLYKVVTEATFDWPMDDLEPSLPAQPHDVLQILQAGGVVGVSIRVESHPFKLLNQEIWPGAFVIHIAQAKLRKAELDRGLLSGTPRCEMWVRAVDGVARYEFEAPPRPGGVEDDALLRALANAEDQLTRRLAARYELLAAATVSDLTDDEVEAVTERPSHDQIGISPTHRR